MKEISSRPADSTSSIPPRAPKSRRASGAKRQLTRREKEILRFLALGMGTSAISRELSISPATVRNHAQRILAKLQVHSRLAAVARGYALGLLASPQWMPAPSADPPRWMRNAPAPG
jgi:DNA-binding NarL/FixJ family response regulator